jgi:predicted metal-dependent hydrolase
MPDLIPLPEEYLEFARLFNAGRYYDAHEVLEDLWVVEVPPLKDFYQALIMAAVAVCHWQRGNHAAARRVWMAADTRLAPYPAQFEEFEVREFRLDLAGLFRSLENGAPHPWTEAIRARVPVIRIGIGS